jgi:hypothetical protein
MDEYLFYWGHGNGYGCNYSDGYGCGNMNGFGDGYDGNGHGNSNSDSIWSYSLKENIRISNNG